MGEVSIVYKVNTFNIKNYFHSLTDTRLSSDESLINSLQKYPWIEPKEPIKTWPIVD